MKFDVTDCPFCGLPAEVLDRYDYPSTDGDVPHVFTRCIRRHIYNGPEETHG